MSDSPPPRKSGPWPLLAISLLVLLLAAFLIVKFRQHGDEKPLVVKAADRPAPPPDPAVPAPPSIAPPAVVVEATPDLQDRMAALEKALKDRRWDEAGKALEGLKDVEPFRARIAEGRKAEEEARKEALAREEEKRKRDQAWLAEREKIEKAKDAGRWDEAVAIFDALLKAFPDLDKVEDVVVLRKNLDGLRKESDGLFTKEMAEADKQAKAGSYAQASTTSEKAIRYYPERTPAVREFQARIRVAKIEAEM